MRVSHVLLTETADSAGFQKIKKYRDQCYWKYFYVTNFFFIFFFFTEQKKKKKKKEASNEYPQHMFLSRNKIPVFDLITALCA